MQDPAVDTGIVRAIALTVPGPPKGKGRPKFSRHGDRVVTRTPGDTKRAENRVQLAWMENGRLRLPDLPLTLKAEFVLARPKDHWRADGTLTPKGQRNSQPLKKPDLDNAVKLICDALNGLAYRDDAYIFSMAAWKRWQHRPDEPEQTIIRLAVLNSVGWT